VADRSQAARPGPGSGPGRGVIAGL